MRQIIVQATKYEAKGGSVHDTEQECEHHEKVVQGTRKQCSHCGGAGVNDPYGDGRHLYQCDYCKGKGWVEKQEAWK